MEVSSMILCKGYIPWQGLLLTASFLTYWYLPTTAQVIIELVPPNVFQGENVRLEVHNLPEDFLAFAWYRGVTNLKRGIAVYAKRNGLSASGPAYSGRQTVYSDGSLLLQSVIIKDTGFYTLRVISRQGEIISTTSVFLHVQISILTCGGRTTSDQPTIEIVPPNVAEGANVLLLARDLPENLQTFLWYKGVISFITYEIARHTTDKNSSVPGPAHSGRETLYSNGSLLLHNVTLNDIGFYTLKTLSTDMKLELIHVHLQVNEPVTEPFLQVTDTTVTVQSSVVFSCLSTDTRISIRWLFNNQSLQITERMTLSPTKCGLSIDPVRREDAGYYKCEVSNAFSSEISLPVRLMVTNK
ncbi:carcinoembryonic antigen-related cell adhesion molecule 3-like [Chionomys nivalis]|uniref:carcinoembryonic antigen-related cell adhesion molecule 3-like n=1 Tax=Chionomys nivalis TaxID=269649 RepID=UPI0025943D57|nr:carcinoembryonic antigen-related cell adhesion molecule 3-like [Chionomys nivalis]